MSKISFHGFTHIFHNFWTKLQNLAQNLSLKNPLIPLENKIWSKPCALATNSTWNLHSAVNICSPPNMISVFCFNGSKKSCETKKYVDQRKIAQ